MFAAFSELGAKSVLNDFETQRCYALYRNATHQDVGGGIPAPRDICAPANFAGGG